MFFSRSAQIIPLLILNVDTNWLRFTVNNIWLLLSAESLKHAISHGESHDSTCILHTSWKDEKIRDE